jgi:two-component system, OmpR family, catabolic regulation response regulator CreB
MPRIVIVEDEPAIADTLAFTLRADGHETAWHQRAGEALESLRSAGADLVILDVGLPDITGFEACKALRRFSDVPVIFLTARAEEVDRVVGLEIGADDYVVKPFSPREVAARVRAILKRRPGGAAGAPPDVRSDDARGVVIDAARRVARYRGQAITLTAQEYRLLECLVSQPERVFSREQLLDALGVSREAGYERNVDGHVRDVRAKLRAVAPDAEPIQTHRGFGYSYQPARC